MARRIPKIDRRVDEEIVFVERRKGKLWMYGEIVVSIGIILFLWWLLK